jgi:hypothetical protein
MRRKNVVVGISSRGEKKSPAHTKKQKQTT